MTELKLTFKDVSQFVVTEAKVGWCRFFAPVIWGYKTAKGEKCSLAALYGFEKK